MTRKELETPVKYVAKYRVLNLVHNFEVDEDAQKSEIMDTYDFWSRADALKAMRQFIWDTYKQFGHLHDIDEFSVDCIGWDEKWGEE